MQIHKKVKFVYNLCNYDLLFLKFCELEGTKWKFSKKHLFFRKVHLLSQKNPKCNMAQNVLPVPKKSILVINKPSVIISTVGIISWFGAAIILNCARYELLNPKGKNAFLCHDSLNFYIYCVKTFV